MSVPDLLNPFEEDIWDPINALLEEASPIEQMMKDMNGMSNMVGGPTGPDEEIIIEEKTTKDGKHIHKEIHREGNVETVKVTSDQPLSMDEMMKDMEETAEEVAVTENIKQ